MMVAERLAVIKEAMEYILQQDDGRKRFMQAVALVYTEVTMEVKTGQVWLIRLKALSMLLLLYQLPYVPTADLSAERLLLMA